eukprot:3993797-Amphidinium_carterae.1
MESNSDTKELNTKNIDESSDRLQQYFKPSTHLRTFVRKFIHAKSSKMLVELACSRMTPPHRSSNCCLSSELLLSTATLNWRSVCVCGRVSK